MCLTSSFESTATSVTPWCTPNSEIVDQSTQGDETELMILTVNLGGLEAPCGHLVLEEQIKLAVGAVPVARTSTTIKIGVLSKETYLVSGRRRKQ
jgi:hypothetical protein